MVADDACCSVGGTRVAALELHVRFGADRKETAGLVQGIQPFEIQEPTIHDVERSRLWNQHVEHIHLVQLAVRNMDEAGNIATQVEQGVQLDCESPRDFEEALIPERIEP